MNKELEALENLYEYLIDEYEFRGMEDIDKNKKIIENALKDYERRLALAKEYKDVNNVAKRLKALEIIKEKGVSTRSWYYNDCNKIPYEIYKQSIMTKTISSELLTQEEYDLLKEILDE